MGISESKLTVRKQAHECGDSAFEKNLALLAKTSDRSWA
jgi:hypothetical protein